MKEKKISFESRLAPLRTSPNSQPRFLTLSQMRLSHNGILEHDQIHLELMYRPLQLDERGQHFIGADDESRSVAVLVLLVVVENGYDR